MTSIIFCLCLIKDLFYFICKCVRVLCTHAHALTHASMCRGGGSLPVPVSVCRCYCLCPGQREEGIVSPGAGITMNCELPDIGV